MNNITAPNTATIKSWLSGDQILKQLAKALPTGTGAERAQRAALTSLQRQPDLGKCSQASFFSAFLSLANLGLVPDGREAHLLPFRNKQGGFDCVAVPDWKGLAKLVTESGRISTIHRDVVCENDVFEYSRGRIVRHDIDFRKPRGDIYAAYSLVTFKDGTESAEVMGIDEIEAIRKRSRSAEHGPWVTDFWEMSKKTVFKRHSKVLPIAPEVLDLMDAANVVDSNPDAMTVVSAPPPAMRRIDEPAPQPAPQPAPRGPGRPKGSTNKPAPAANGAPGLRPDQQSVMTWATENKITWAEIQSIALEYNQFQADDKRDGFEDLIPEDCEWFMKNADSLAPYIVERRTTAPTPTPTPAPSGQQAQ